VFAIDIPHNGRASGGAFRRAPRALALGLLLASVTALAACSNPAPPDLASASADTELLEQALADARSGGADPSQIQILEQAAAAGSISFDEAQEATEAMLKCVEDAGFTVGNKGVDDSHGLEVATFTISAPASLDEAQADVISSDCETRYRRWVEFAWENQPAAQDAFAVQVEQHRAEIVACLNGDGSDIGADAPIDEMVSEALRLSAEAIDAGETNVTDCFFQVGLTI